MTDYAALTRELYRHHGTWRGVAAACGGNKSAAYWYRIANGSIAKPNKAARSAIIEASRRASLLVTAGYIDAVRRKNISVSTGLYQRLNAKKVANSLSWNELIEALLNKADCDNLG